MSLPSSSSSFSCFTCDNPHGRPVFSRRKPNKTGDLLSRRDRIRSRTPVRRLLRLGTLTCDYLQKRACLVRVQSRESACRGLCASLRARTRTSSLSEVIRRRQGQARTRNRHTSAQGYPAMGSRKELHGHHASHPDEQSSCRSSLRESRLSERILPERFLSSTGQERRCLSNDILSL